MNIKQLRLIASLSVAGLLSGCPLESSNGTRTSAETGTKTPVQQVQQLQQVHAIGAASHPMLSPARQAARAQATGGYSLDFYASWNYPEYQNEWGSTTTPGAVSAAIGDVTGDGRADIVGGFLSAPGSAIMTIAQRADGTYSDPVTYQLPDDESPERMLLADLNEDGAQDIVITGNQLRVLLSTRDGHYTMTSYPTQIPFDVPAVAADFDGDGHIDIATHLDVGYGDTTSEIRPAQLVIRYGDGRGGFHSTRTMPLFAQDDPHDRQMAYSMAVGDINGDNHPDLMLRVQNFDFSAQIYQPLIVSLINDGWGSFKPPVSRSAIRWNGQEYTGQQGLLIGDLTGDGLQDLVVSTDSVVKQEILVYPQLANGTLSNTPIVRGTSPIPTPLAIADLDGNGAKDLVAIHSGWGSVGYYLQSDGALAEEKTAFIGALYMSPNAQAIGEATGDACPDVVIAGSYSGLRLLRGAGCAVPQRTMSRPSPPRRK